MYTDNSARKADSLEKANTTILLATLMRVHGDTGLQTHLNDYHNYLQEHRPNISVRIANPFAAGFPAYPLLGFHRLLHYFSSSWAVGWRHYVHYRLLKLILRNHISALLEGKSDRVIVQAQCPWSARAAIEVKRELPYLEQARLKVSMTVHFNRSQAEEWKNRDRLRSGHPAYRLLLRTEQFAICNVNSLVFVSEFMRGYLEQRYPCALSTPSKVVPNSIPLDASEGKMKPELNGDLISIGSLERRKNQTFLLKVLKNCKERGYDYRLTLIGDGEDRTRLEQKATELGVEDLVTFAGYIPHAGRQIRSHRAYVHAAFIESFGIVILEALAASVPVFAYPTGGVSEVFTDGREGRYWNVQDAEAAADKLIEVLEDDDLYKELSASAGKRAREFSSEEIFEELFLFVHG